MSKYVIKGNELEDEGDLEGALNRYEMCLDDSSCPWCIRYYMGRVHNKLRNFKDALNCFDNVLTMDKKHIYSLFGKGIACLGLNKWDDALNSFLKAIRIDDANANYYYYVSIILQSKNDDESHEYYSKFIELDNDYFKQIRSNYDFGLIFLNAELELANDDKIINLTSFKEVLKSFDLMDDEIEDYLKTLPYDMLILKINELNDIAYVENEKSIIRNQYLEMGFTDNDVDDYFIIDTIDVLKEDIISRTKNNPFPEKNEIDIPLYIDKDNYIFEDLIIEEKPVDDKIRIREITKTLEDVFRCRYAIMKELISNTNFEYANWLSDFIDESKIYDESFRVNFIYMRGLILSYLNLDLNKVLDDFKLLENDYPKIKENKSYIHNKKNIEKNLEKNI